LPKIKLQPELFYKKNILLLFFLLNAIMKADLITDYCLPERNQINYFLLSITCYIATDRKNNFSLYSECLGNKK